MRGKRKKLTKLNEKKAREDKQNAWMRTEAEEREREKWARDLYAMLNNVMGIPTTVHQTPNAAQHKAFFLIRSVAAWIMRLAFFSSSFWFAHHSMNIYVYCRRVASRKMADRQQREKSFCKINLFLHRIIFFSFFRCIHNVQIWKMNSFKLKLNRYSCFNFCQPCHYSI